MVKQSILDYANEVSTKCKCGGDHVLSVGVKMVCTRTLEGRSDCHLDPVDLQEYEIRKGEQFFLVINANNKFTAIDMARGVQQANKKVFGVK